jgi:hypothetical protein
MPSTPQLVDKPVAGPEAFRRKDWPATLSQTAILLALGQQLHAIRRAVKPWLPAAHRLTPAAAPPAALGAASAAVEAEQAQFDRPEFPIPRLKPQPEPVQPGGAPTLAPATRAEAARPLPALVPYEPQTAHALAEKTYADPLPENARELLQHCRGNKHELVRVAAAVALFPTTAQPAPLVETLLKGCRSRNLAVRTLAVHALGIVDPQNPALQRFLKPARKRKKAGPPTETTLLVHGTWARTEPWWQPGGDFPGFLSGVRNDVYAADDRYDWTGAYSDAARDLAADQLVDWFGQRPEHVRPTLFTHSHGASVAMLATNKGLQLDTLVLLSCPVHADKYLPDFANVNRVVSIRVTNDYVILLDGGRQRFSDPRIEEKVLPIWFDHSATHYPDTWQQYDLANVMNLHLP